LKEDWKKQKAVIRNIANYPLIIKDGSRKERKRMFSRELDPGRTNGFDQDI
jgi:hypothetical protein